MWSNEIILIKESYTFDEIGNQEIIEERNTVFCEVKSISRSEFYNAATAGLKPSIVFVVHSFEYTEEEKVEFEGKSYRVIRTYLTNTDVIELTCEKVIGNG